VVRTLVDGKQMAGNYIISWDGNDSNGQLVASGIYIYKLHTQNFLQTKKMVLMR
jgi:flagellar hook assembly protein FlgD